MTAPQLEEQIEALLRQRAEVLLRLHPKWELWRRGAEALLARASARATVPGLSALRFDEWLRAAVIQMRNFIGAPLSAPLKQLTASAMKSEDPTVKIAAKGMSLIATHA